MNFVYFQHQHNFDFFKFKFMNGSFDLINTLYNFFYNLYDLLNILFLNFEDKPALNYFKNFANKKSSGIPTFCSAVCIWKTQSNPRSTNL